MRPLIHFRRLNRPVEVTNTGRVIETWEIAFSEAHLFAKLDGEMAEVDMPALSWYVRLRRRWFPLRIGRG